MVQRQRSWDHGKDDAVRITTAASDRREDQRKRQKRYLISMSLRTICFVGALVVGDNVFRWILVAGAVFLPYVAVVLANAASSRRDDFVMGPIVSQTSELTAGERSHSHH